MAGAVLEGVVVDKPIEVVCQRTGHFGWATGAGAIHQALDPLVGEAMDPLAQRGIGKVQRVGHRLEAVPLDDLAYGLGTAEDAGLLGLLKEGIQGGESLLGKVEFEGPHSGGLQEKLLQKFTQVHSSWVLLSEQNLFDSNFSGAAIGPLMTNDKSLAMIERLGVFWMETGAMLERTIHDNRNIPAQLFQLVPGFGNLLRLFLGETLQRIDLLYAPVRIALVCCHINSFRRASRCGEAMARRRKYDGRIGIVSQGI